MQRFSGENGLSGQALLEKALAELTAGVDKARRWFEPGACFAAGTLVHTKEGLKPIEQIQVGDWVLSKPENDGEQAYKRVVKIFAHPPERVVRVGYTLPGQNLEDLIASAQAIKVGHLIATPGHPFWTKEQGWTAVIGMQGQGPEAFHFEDKDGGEIGSWDVKNIYISDQSNVGWMPGRLTVRTDGTGQLWDFLNHKLIATGVAAIQAVEDIWDSGNPDELYFKLPVYNLEVEDFHTYYVGEHGIWVHNQNCNGLNFEARTDGVRSRLATFSDGGYKARPDPVCDWPATSWLRWRLLKSSDFQGS